MSLIGRWVRLLVVVVSAAILAIGNARASPQIVAAVLTGGDVELVCAGSNCSAEFSSICLQQSRVTPSPMTSYVIRGPDQDAFTVTGHREDGGTVTLAPDVLRFASLRGHLAFRASAPAAFLKSHGLTRLTVRIERLAVLMPVPQDGDPNPQTAGDEAQAVRELKTTGTYWTEMNTENLAMARLTNRIINLLPAKGSVSAATGEILWRRGIAAEQGMSEDTLAVSRSYFDYCRANALTPGSFPMRRCLGNAHDWFMKDPNVNYWKSVKPTS